MPKFTCHLFVCGNQRSPGHSRGCCDATGRGELRERFKRELKARGLTDGKLGPLVRANGAGCLDQCELGPVVVLYPQEIWYGGVTPDDVPRIIDETILGGRVLEDLVIPEDKLNRR
jgi:(2Fe-2S) ferredoxin